jgi:plasmid maintenance system antidote protein VapI
MKILKFEMMERKISPEEMGANMGITSQAVRNMINGATRLMTKERAEMISEVLEMPVSDFAFPVGNKFSLLDKK